MSKRIVLLDAQGIAHQANIYNSGQYGTDFSPNSPDFADGGDGASKSRLLTSAQNVVEHPADFIGAADYQNTAPVGNDGTWAHTTEGGVRTEDSFPVG